MIWSHLAAVKLKYMRYRHDLCDEYWSMPICQAFTFISCMGEREKWYGMLHQEHQGCVYKASSPDHKFDKYTTRSNTSLPTSNFHQQHQRSSLGLGQCLPISMMRPRVRSSTHLLLFLQTSNMKVQQPTMPQSFPSYTKDNPPNFHILVCMDAMAPTTTTRT